MDIYHAPFGHIYIEYEGDYLREISFEKKEGEITETDFSKEIKGQLDEYFLGKRFDFNIPIMLNGTYFQEKVWNELIKIPYGTTMSYEDIAIKINNPKACRAVGLANNKNKIPIIIPCHRVIGKNGSLTGFAGGLDTKAFLLEHEKRWSRK